MHHSVGIIVILLTCGAEGMLLFGQKPMIDDLIIGRILGTLDASLLMVLSYYFGASAATSASGQRAEDRTEVKSKENV